MAKSHREIHNWLSWIFSEYLQPVKRAVTNIARQEMHDNIWKHWAVLNSVEACDGTKFCCFPLLPPRALMPSDLQYMPHTLGDATPHSVRKVSFLISIHWSIITSVTQSQVGAKVSMKGSFLPSVALLLHKTENSSAGSWVWVWWIRASFFFCWQAFKLMAPLKDKWATLK